MATAQERLDEAVSALGEDVTAIQEEVQRLKDQAPPELDFSRLDELVGRVEAVAHPAEPETPEEPTPGEPTV